MNGSKSMIVLVSLHMSRRQSSWLSWYILKSHMRVSFGVKGPVIVYT